MKRWLLRVVAVLLSLLVLSIGVGWWLLQASVPRLDGNAGLQGLSAPVRMERDVLGSVTVDAANAVDAARALGYVHGQERYFEMDLLRRSASGELAELFGPSMLKRDRTQRMHRMRAHAEEALGALDPDQRSRLQAYAAGVNAGLAALRARPWPYLLLRQRPRTWAAADSLLAADAMYFDLQDAQGARKRGLLGLRLHLPDALYRLVTHPGSAWDAPLTGASQGDALLPDAATVDLRTLPEPQPSARPALADAFFPPSMLPSAWGRRPSSSRMGRNADGAAAVAEQSPGSNSFAVSGAMTANGRSIVAGDMHLSLGVPNLWFRVRMRYPDPRASSGRVDVTGFSLPGLPAVIVGSNGHVAWSFTNSFADNTDLFRVHPCNGPTQSACEPVVVHREILHVAGREDEVLVVRQTRYGPLLQDQADGRALALRWTGQLPGAINLGIADFARADGLKQLIDTAAATAIPALNMVAGDAQGQIAWSVVGPLPVRAAGCRDDGVSPVIEASDACPPWAISTRAFEPLVDPPDGRLWSANNRMADGARLAVLGDGGYVLGARAQQIRDDLQRRSQFDEAALLAIQLDDRAVFLQRWWAMLQDEGANAPKGSALAEVADAASHWDGRASPESVSYRLVRHWRLAVSRRIADGLTAPARAALGEDFDAAGLGQLEGVVWPLLQQRPVNLLPRRFACKVASGPPCSDQAGWTRLLEDAAVEVRDALSPDEPLRQRTWGQANTAAICHPLARALPTPLRPWLCMPAQALAGDTNMPRVARPGFGASERMVVSPGHEAQGIAHMPGGQSGHPLSPYWGVGQEDWVQGRPTPFLPGPAEHVLQLVPATR